MNGLILTSGGVKCAFQIGVIKALQKLNIQFDIGAGASGGVPVLFGYFNNQLEMTERVWKTVVTSKRFINFQRYFSRHPIMDINYLIYSIMQNEFSFQDNQYMTLKQKIIFPIYNVTKQETHYHTFQRGEKKEALDLIFASIAAPYLNDKMKRIGKHLYCDGAFFDPCPWEQAKTHGAQKLMVIGTRSPRKREYPVWIIKLIFRKHHNQLTERQRKRVLNFFHIHDQKMDILLRKNDRNTIIITPRNISRFKYHVINNSRTAIDDLIKHGFNTIMKNPSLQRQMSRVLS